MKKIVFTDEKDFTIEIVKNCQNDRVYGPSKKADIAPNRLYHESSRFSRKVWSLPVFLGREKQTSTLLTRGELKLTAKPTSICSMNNYIFQQDGASSYTSRASPDYLTENTNQFIKKDE